MQGIHIGGSVVNSQVAHTITGSTQVSRSEKIEKDQIERFEEWAKENGGLSLDKCLNPVHGIFMSAHTETIWCVWKIQDDKIQDLESRLHSAKYILEEFYEAEAGAYAYSDVTGLPPGVIQAAFDNIFKGIR